MRINYKSTVIKLNEKHWEFERGRSILQLGATQSIISSYRDDKHAQRWAAIVCFAIVFCFSCVARRETESKQTEEEEEEEEGEEDEAAAAAAAAEEAVEASIIIAHEYSDIGAITLSLFAKNTPRNVTVIMQHFVHSSELLVIHQSTGSNRL